MKRTLVALIVAASTIVSGSTMAWTDGNFSETVDIGGTVKVDAVTWKWKSSQALTGIDLDVNKLVSDGTDNNADYIYGLFEKPVLLLAGKTTGKIEKPAPGFAPHIVFGGKVANYGTVENTKAITLDVMSNSKRIGFLSFDFQPMAVIYGYNNNSHKNVYAGLADPQEQFGNGYYKHYFQYNVMGNDGFKEGLIRALGSDAPDFTGYVADDKMGNVGLFKSDSSPFTQMEGAYAASIMAKSGKFRIYKGYIPASSGQWSANLPITVTYQ